MWTRIAVPLPRTSTTFRNAARYFRCRRATVGSFEKPQSIFRRKPPSLAKENTMPIQKLDCRGLACPGPVVACGRIVRQEAPAALRVLVDNAAAVENVSRFLRANGYTVESAQTEAHLWHVDAARHADAPATAPSAPQAPAAAVPSAGGKTLVLITTETLGRGDDDLGAKLMDNFLSTLPELGDNLWRVILLNGGVKLAARPGKALDSLRTLETAGVDILVCGTCLDFYQLLDAKAVGQTTNMLDVVSSLALADKVIRP